MTLAALEIQSRADLLLCPPWLCLSATSLLEENGLLENCVAGNYLSLSTLFKAKVSFNRSVIHLFSVIYVVFIDSQLWIQALGEPDCEGLNVSNSPRNSRAEAFAPSVTVPGSRAFKKHLEFVALDEVTGWGP